MTEILGMDFEDLLDEVDTTAEFNHLLAAETAPTSCVTRGNPTILRCFPAHNTALTQTHKDELDRIVVRIRNGDITGKRIRLIHIIGYAAEWWGWHKGARISRAEYQRRSEGRARAAKAYLNKEIARLSLSAKPKIITVGRGIGRPDVPDMPDSSSTKARRNRSLNRRIEIHLYRRTPAPKPKPQPDPATDWEAFLDTKLRQLGDYFDVQRPFDTDSVYVCVRLKLLRKYVRDEVAFKIPKYGPYKPPSGQFVRRRKLRQVLIGDLKAKRGRGKIKAFWLVFQAREDEAVNSAKAVAHRAAKKPVDLNWSIPFRQFQRQASQAKHVYSCSTFRRILKAGSRNRP